EVLQRVARQALASANLAPADVDVVVAGANGLGWQDQAEALALQNLLAKNERFSVTAVKGTIGEIYGASGLFQTLAAVCMIEHGVIPPTLGGARERLAPAPVRGLLREVRSWSRSRSGTALLLAQDLFGSTSAVVLRGCGE